MGTILLVLEWVAFLSVTALLVLLYFTWKIMAIFFVQWLVRNEMFFDNIPEGYATAYESGGRGKNKVEEGDGDGGGKFQSLACSYKEFGAVKAPGDLDWAIRRPGDSDDWPEWISNDGERHPAETHVYVKADFQWDRRLWFIKKIFGDETGIVYMGRWPAVKPKYYDLRISNFRTVPPSKEETERKTATVREYKVGEADEKGNRQAAGYLVSWNERTPRVLLSDDVYPFPVDGVRIGTDILSRGNNQEKRKQQAVVANILPFLRARIQEPYLYLYRNQDTLEVIQNELIQHVRELVAGMSIEEVFAIKATLQREREGQENVILQRNDFGLYMRTRYGFAIKSASFGYIDITGTAGIALAAPYVAQQNANAEAIRGEGLGQSEKNRLTREGEAFGHLVEKVGPELAMALRSADVADNFATSQNKTNTLLFGFDLKTILGNLGNGAKTPTPGKENGSANDTARTEQPKQ